MDHNETQENNREYVGDNNDSHSSLTHDLHQYVAATENKQSKAERERKKRESLMESERDLFLVKNGSKGEQLSF
jgi:hypothetical protein